jgi:hypothetical protein
VLRMILVISGILSLVGTIAAILLKRIDIVPPNTILIGLICLAVADVMRRVERIEKHLNLLDEDEKEIEPNYAHPLEKPQRRPSSSK